MKLMLLGLSIIMLNGLMACHADTPQSSKAALAAPLHTIALKIGPNQLTAELADTPATMERGLMFRDSMPEDHGMLFVFDQPQQANFWMRNTKIPLSIAYVDRNGCILEIYDMFPYDESNVPSHSHQVSFALEMNQGWFTRHQVKAGDVIQGKPFPSK